MRFILLFFISLWHIINKTNYHMELPQYLQNLKTGRFKVLAVEDSRKTNSTVDIGCKYLCTRYPDECVYFMDINEQEWCFYVRDTCSIIEEIITVATY